MVFRLRFESPMSRLVAAAHGTAFFLVIVELMKRLKRKE
jgi:hypothetical protein